jgi:Cof subfamily protein (haloacid dehalogenase superfamily)
MVLRLQQTKGLTHLYRLIASDMDDTLLSPAGTLEPRTFRALKRAMDAGVFLVLASGRMLESVLPFARELSVNAPIIAYNGAMVYDLAHGRVLNSAAIPMETARGICRMAEENGIYIQAYPGEGYVAEARRPYTKLYEDSIKVECGITGVKLSEWIATDQIKLLVIGEKEDTLKHIEMFQQAFPGVTFMMSRPNYIEIVAGDVDKRWALEQAIRALGVSREEVLAFGDGQNDISMLNFAHLGYCMENATPGVRAQCKNFAPSNAQEGCAIIIERMLDSGQLGGA